MPAEPTSLPIRRCVGSPPSAVALLLVLTVGLGSLGCGYTLVGRASAIPEDVQELYLAPFENRTRRAEVEQFIGQAVAEELVKRQRFRVVSEREEADAELRGAVAGFSVTPVTFDGQGRAQEYEVAIIASVLFQRVRLEAAPDEPPEVLWQNERYVFKETYELGAEGASFFDRENLAIEESAERFAETMVTDLLEGF